MLKSSVRKNYDFNYYLKQKKRLNKETCKSTSKRIRSYYENYHPTRLSRDNLLKDYLTLINQRKYNYWGTVTSQFAKSETYFRQLLLGNTYIRKHNHTDLPEHVLSKIIRKQRLYKRQGLEPPSLLELITKYKKQIDFYQNGNFIKDGIKVNILDPTEQNYTIKNFLNNAEANSFFGVLEYGKKNGYCHLHFLLHHDDIENVHERIIYKANGTISKRFITSRGNKLQSLFYSLKQIGHTDLQLIESQEKTIKYITKYLLKQSQGFGIDRKEPLLPHSTACVVRGDGFIMHNKNHKEGYCEQIYKGSYKNGKEKIIDMPVHQFYDMDLSYLKKTHQLNLI